MTPTVTVIDYGSGNLHSVARAFEQCGANVILSQDKEKIQNAEHLVLPGVGAFHDGMKGLHGLDIIESIQQHAKSGRPLLGICLGMQMLASSSMEFGMHKGLDLIPGKVLPLPLRDQNGVCQKIPHIGWVDLEEPFPLAWENTIFSNYMHGSSVYLVHSYHFVPDKSENLLAQYSSGGNKIAAAVQSGQVIGCQFHPEKSGAVGQGLLKSFLRI